MALRLDKFAYIFVIILLLGGCATYQKKVTSARDLIRKRDFQGAIQELKPLAEKEGDDQLVYLLDYATALHLAGDFKESNRIFSLADDMSEVKDYTSLSREAGSILLNEGLVQYKGDDYEKVLINAFKAINYIMLGDLEAALVEARRLNEKLYKYKFEAKRDYEQNTFANYLSGILWEADKNWDNAFISYNDVYKLAPNIDLLHEDLVRSAIKAQRNDELETFLKKFSEVKIKDEWKNRDYGELVVIYQQGWGPRKDLHPQTPKFPKLYPRRSVTQELEIQVQPVGRGPSSSNLSFKSQKVYSVQDVAIKTLDDAYAQLVAKRMVGVAAKYLLAEQIRQKNKLLGAVAWIGLNAVDQADLRQWSTLPESFQLIRARLPSGKYNLSGQGISSYGDPTGEAMDPQSITIKAGKKTFVTWRSFR